MPWALAPAQNVSNRDIKLENTLLETQLGRKPMLKLCGACDGLGAQCGAHGRVCWCT